MKCTFLFILFLSVITPPALAAQKDIIMYPRPLSSSDTRFEYHLAQLREALQRTIPEYGPFELQPTAIKMNQLRQLDLLQSGSPVLDIAIKPTSIERERLLTPVRIPIAKGLLGWRLLLVHKNKQILLSSVKTIEDLRGFTLGQGFGWADIPTLRQNGFEVIEGGHYESLFKMLFSGRFDLFPRGLSEAFSEWEERHKEWPDLHIEEELLLHYPFVRYFWTANTPRGKRLNERITKGLEAMIQDGAFDARFNKYYDETIRRAKLENRRLIQLEAYDLPPMTPLERKELWFDPFATQ